jgi:hypothetical protein
MMKIDFERTGGFAGMKLQAAVRTETLSPEQAAELHALVAAADFFRLPAVIVTSAPDQFHYRVTVAEGLRRHTIQTTDSAAPAALRPLLERLAALARATR